MWWMWLNLNWETEHGDDVSDWSDDTDDDTNN